MAKHVDVQRKAQEEIDRVIGSNRLPNHSDRPYLPYIEAIYREALRYSQPLGIGAPHALTEDDTYKGYFLPKGNHPRQSRSDTHSLFLRNNGSC